MYLQLNVQMKLPNGQSAQEIGFRNIIEKVTGGDHEVHLVNRVCKTSSHCV